MRWLGRGRLGALAAVLAGCLGALAPGAPGAWAPAGISGIGASAPQVAADSQGRATIVWQRLEGTTSLIEASSREPGGGWGPAVPLSAPDPLAAGAQVAIDPGGTAIAVWSTGSPGGTVIQAATRPPGGSWSDPVDISALGQPVDLPRLVVDAQGNATVVWVRQNETYWTIQAAHRPAGGSWGGQVDLSPPGEDSDFPDLVVDAQGNLTVAWVRYDAQDVPSVRTASRSAAGAWSGLGDLAPLGDAVQLAVDGQGAVTAVWRKPDGAVQSALRPPGAGWQQSGTIATGGGTYSLDLAVDAQGTATAVWVSGDTVQAATRAGGAWQAQGPIAAPGGAPAGIRVAATGPGSAIALWTRAGVLQSAVRAAGGSWSPAEDVAGGGRNPQLTTSASGEGVVAWAVATPLGTVIQTATRDLVPPRLDALSVPGGVQVGRALGVSVSAVDALSPPVGVSWSFGDGAVAQGAQAAHAWAAPGAYTVVVSARDGAGNVATAVRQVQVGAQPPAPKPAPDRTAPRVSAISLSATRIGLKVSEASSVRVRVSRCRAVTRKVKGKRRKVTICTTVRTYVPVKPKKPKKAKPVCRRAAAELRLGAARPSAMRVNLCRRLGAGRYKVRVIARDRAGNQRTVTVAKRVAPPPKRSSALKR